MHPLLSITFFWLPALALPTKGHSPFDCVPRKSVPFHRVNALMFHEEGVFDYSTMLLREDLDLLVVGAREVVYALDMNNISKKHASVKWEATEQEKSTCRAKGKDPDTECHNYIRILHKMDDNRMYLCGTNAFAPKCDYMSYADGHLTLEGKTENGRGKCPLDPSQRFASIMADNNLYSATFTTFWSTSSVISRISPVFVRTDDKTSWLNVPRFVSMAQMPNSEKNEDNDDKVYVFFSEKAVEHDCHEELVVSRVARVCKGDHGGFRVLYRKWTSFLKARIDCPVLKSQLPYIIQDTYLLCEPQQHWKNCLFYAIFTSSDMSGLSAVCAYRVSDINKVFAEGHYKKKGALDDSYSRWMKYYGEVPFPRPGACINDEIRRAGINKTEDLPDKTLTFLREGPIMDPTIQPIGEKPLLVRKGAAFTRIIVNQVQAADGEKYHVMFIGTEDGKILKASNYGGEMFIIEEIELFQALDPIKIMKFSDIIGQLYAGSNYGAAQIPLASCERSLTCLDCVLARDPYCGWDKVIGKCIALSNSERELIQSVKAGSATHCPVADPVKPLRQSFWPSGNLMLRCPMPSNLAKARWEQDNRSLSPSAQLLFLQDGLLILNATSSSSGRYRCLSVEHSETNEHTTIVAEYQLTMRSVEALQVQHPCPRCNDTRRPLSSSSVGSVRLQSVTGLLLIVGLSVFSVLVF